MKKIVLSILIGISVTTALCGCAQTLPLDDEYYDSVENASGTEDSENDTSEDEITDNDSSDSTIGNTSDTDITISAYKDFLDNKTTVTIGDDVDFANIYAYSFSNPLAIGSNVYLQDFLNMINSDTNAPYHFKGLDYAVTDFGKDNTQDLALRFHIDVTDMDYVRLYAFITQNDNGELVLTHIMEDWCRSSVSVCENGAVWDGGAAGATSHVMTLSILNEAGKPTQIYNVQSEGFDSYPYYIDSENKAWESFATDNGLDAASWMGDAYPPFECLLIEIIQIGDSIYYTYSISEQDGEALPQEDINRIESYLDYCEMYSGITFVPYSTTDEIFETVLNEYGFTKDEVATGNSENEVHWMVLAESAE